VTQHSLSQYQTDHLFLLVGTNPLPNYVAAMLLAKGDGKIYLLHTPTKKGTGVVASRLKTAIVRDLPGMIAERVILREISESNRNDIVSKVNTLLNQMNRSVGLNYTGGMKPMALHVYRAIEQRLGTDAIFSYLDARSLEMLIEEHRGVPAQSQLVPRNLQLSLEHLMALHGYVRAWDEEDVKRRKAVLNREGKPQDAPQQTPVLEDLCRALATVHSTEEGFREWRKFIKPRPLRRLPLTSDDELLKPVAEVLEQLRVDGRAAEAELIRILEMGKAGLESCRHFLQGDWLEEYVLSTLAETVRALDIKHYGINLKPLRPGEKDAPSETNEHAPSEEEEEQTEKKEKEQKKDKRQIDLAAMYGYQLFTISCQVTKNKDSAQEHLFEVFTRARQLGGDEARVGVITCLDPSTAALLQREIEQDWDADGKIKVFAKDHLPRLSAHLTDWFKQVNKG